MKIVVLDGHTLNPGDLSWDGFGELGKVTVHERTPVEQVAERIAGAEAVITKQEAESATRDALRLRAHAETARLDAEPRPVLTGVPFVKSRLNRRDARPCKHTLELRKKIRLNLWPVV